MQTEIANIVNTLLRRCEIPLRTIHIDEEFLRLCLEDAADHGCPMEDIPGTPSFRPWNISGAAIAFTSYGHLECLSTKKYIALYTSLAVYIEDVYKDKGELTDGFNRKFIMHAPQETAVLQALDQCLRETAMYFDTVQTNLIISSTLNFVTAISIEYAVEKMQVSAAACNFADFLRGLSGISCAYAIFIFPKGVPIDSYIQSIPSMTSYINHMKYALSSSSPDHRLVLKFISLSSDVLSFYKEEAEGEGNNYVSVLSKHRGDSKIEVLDQLAQVVASSHLAVVDTLSSCPSALKPWMCFARGYVGFHTSYARYRLDQLLEMDK